MKRKEEHRFTEEEYRRLGDFRFRSMVAFKQFIGKTNSVKTVKGHITICTKIVGREEDRIKYQVQFSFVDSSKDYFNRKRGQYIAGKRLLEGIPYNITITKGEKLIEKLKEACLIEARRKNIYWMDVMTTEDLF